MPVAKAAMSYVTQTAKNHNTEVAKLFMPKSSLFAAHSAIPRKYLWRRSMRRPASVGHEGPIGRSVAGTTQRAADGLWTVGPGCKFGCKVRCPRSADGPGGYQFFRRLMRPNKRTPVADLRSIRVSKG